MEDGIKKLYAKSGSHILIDNNAPVIIGKAYQTKRYMFDETIVFQEVVEFNYGNSSVSDSFFFEDNQLVYYSISLLSEPFVLNCYRELLKAAKVSPEVLISFVTEKYTLKQMGF
jgi:hypothetical protein